MTKTTYNSLKAEIIKLHGKPEYDLNQPINESARKLVELRLQYQKEELELKKTKQLIKETEQLEPPTDVPSMPLPDELLKDSWLTPFDADGRTIIRAWIEDITQNARKLATKTGLDIKLVRNTLNSEAFKLLRSNLALAYKSLLPLEASSALRRCLHSRDLKIALAALKLVLEDSGLYKSSPQDVHVTQTKEVILDPETEERLRRLGDQLLDDGKH